MQGDIDWTPVITAKLPGRRKYATFTPNSQYDQNSASNSGYWAERMADDIPRIYPGAKIIRIEMKGTLR
jgi:hypothetical protein